MYFSAQALARRVEKLANEAWSDVGLSPSHAYLLMIVLDEPGIQPSALVKELLLTPSTVTRLIEKLEEKKLVERTSEGRITNVYPTRQAKSLQPKLKECLHHFYQTYAAVLGKEESARIVQSMNRITDKLDS